jgi:1-acyl-sn-glycerol-3-phosphate acyltransferase
LARALFAVFYRIDVSGAENIQDGATMVCANHSSMLDPFIIAFAFGIGHHMHIIAKAELFRIPVLSAFLNKLGMIRVNRSIADIATVRSSLGYLKSGEKVAIFPEGTRVSSDDAVSAKIGAIKLAERAGVPIVPFFIPRKKPLFRKIRVIIGKPYNIDRYDGKRPADDYEQLTETLMLNISSLAR